ncbi:hypothetical protein [Ornithinimicrobium cryptoxanthini]|uniref:hypothetical protein n=1 Tax=Ornithinimicrobium cryptoxanthini TaxID=2934161 RepID=UPI00211760DA|nr:hypothetical protein [Ornithinimicrobium cryptoxanthini]
MKAAARSAGWGMVGHLAVPASTGLLVLGLPFLLDPQTYGYWQLYLFYALWLGYLTYGVPDGHHLRHAGQDLSTLDAGRFAGKFGYLIAGVAAAALVLAAVGAVVTTDETQRLMWVLACASTVLFVPRTLLTAALQSASRFGPFAAVVLSERGLVVGLTLVAIALVGGDPGNLAVADLLAKGAGLLVGLVVLRRLLALERPDHTEAASDGTSAWAEVRADIGVGSVLVLANLAAVSAHGVLRLAVERRWGIVEFGQVSLAFSAALLVTTAAHAMGWLALPRLARTPQEHFGRLHRLVRDGARGPLAALVLLYLPVQAGLDLVLPDYRSALHYLALLLPLIVVESRWRVMTVGLLKVLRRQRVLLTINLVALAVAVALGLLFTLLAPSTVAVVLSLLAVTVLRSTVTDIWLAHQLHGPWLEGVVLDLLVTGGLLAALSLGGLTGAAVGLAVVGVATWWHRQATVELLTRVRQEVVG